ncbi:MAG: hypothetical protein RIG66_02720 [Coleofasciculus sp. E2-BRE-01]
MALLCPYGLLQVERCVQISVTLKPAIVALKNSFGNGIGSFSASQLRVDEGAIA